MRGELKTASSFTNAQKSAKREGNQGVYRWEKKKKKEGGERDLARGGSVTRQK